MKRADRLKAAFRATRDELRAGPKTSEPRGVALILVMLMLAIVAAFSAEYSYKSYIRFHVAANLRDDVQAYFAARGAMSIAANVIRNKNMAKDLGFPMPPGMNANLETWKSACDFANAFCTGELKFLDMKFLDLKGEKGVGLDDGAECGCRIAAEDGKININRVDTPAEKKQLFGELYRELLRHRAEPLSDPNEFDRELADLAATVIDWADYDKNRMIADQQQVGESQQAETLQPSTVAEPKDAKFDTLQELMLVDGMERDLYCKLAENLTPYATRKLNVNEAPLTTLEAMMCDPTYTSNWAEACYMPSGMGLVPEIPAMKQALWCADFCRTAFEALKMPGFSSKARPFPKFMNEILAGSVNAPKVDAQKVSAVIGYSSKMVRIEASGKSFGTPRALTSVIDTGTGNYVYWREY